MGWFTIFWVFFLLKVSVFLPTITPIGKVFSVLFIFCVFIHVLQEVTDIGDKNIEDKDELYSKNTCFSILITNHSRTPSFYIFIVGIFVWIDIIGGIIYACLFGTFNTLIEYIICIKLSFLSPIGVMLLVIWSALSAPILIDITYRFVAKGKISREVFIILWLIFIVMCGLVVVWLYWRIDAPFLQYILANSNQNLLNTKPIDSFGLLCQKGFTGVELYLSNGCGYPGYLERGDLIRDLSNTCYMRNSVLPNCTAMVGDVVFSTESIHSDGTPCTIRWFKFRLKNQKLFTYFMEKGFRERLFEISQNPLSFSFFCSHFDQSCVGEGKFEDAFKYHLKAGTLESSSWVWLCN